MDKILHTLRKNVWISHSHQSIEKVCTTFPAGVPYAHYSSWLREYCPGKGVEPWTIVVSAVLAWTIYWAVTGRFQSRSRCIYRWCAHVNTPCRQQLFIATDVAVDGHQRTGWPRMTIGWHDHFAHPMDIRAMTPVRYQGTPSKDSSTRLDSASAICRLKHCPARWPSLTLNHCPASHQ